MGNMVFENARRPAESDPFQPVPKTPEKQALVSPVPAQVTPQVERSLTLPANVGNLTAGVVGLGELAQAPAATPDQQAQQPEAKPQLDEAQQRALVTSAMEEMKASKKILRPGDKGVEVLLLQQQLRQLGLNVEATGVYDKATAGYIKALQTGGGLGADSVVGPKTIDQILKLDSVPHKPPPATDDQAGEKPGDKPGEKLEDQADHIPDDPQLAAVYLYNRMRVANAKEDLTDAQKRDLETFVQNWDKNKARYEAVAAKAGVPAKLIAALHWRESTGDFSTYLHQGDPLGKKAVNVPSDIPIFKKWEPAAEHALGMKEGIADAYNIDASTTDEAALASYAERYNGLGYFNKGVASPYAMSGTDQYKSGKYVKDGPKGWRANVKDQQLGVLAMMRAIDQDEAAKAEQAKEQDPSAHFAQ